MDQIFAPWRIEWVERDNKNADLEGCPFCVLAEGDDDRSNLVVARSNHSFVLLNNYPYNPGHAMVIPRRHVDSYAELNDSELLDHARVKQLTLRSLNAGLNPDGFNTGMNLGEGAGGSIGDHIHTHIVPRWKGDTNFMPAVGETTVIVEAVTDTYDRLHEGFVAQPETSLTDSETAVEVSFE